MMDDFYREYISSSKHEGSWENSRQLYKPEGLDNCWEFFQLEEKKNTEKKVLDCFNKYFSKIIRQISENAVYLLLDQNRFSWYALIFPTSRSKRASDNT